MPFKEIPKFPQIYFENDVGNRWFIPNDAKKPEDPRKVRKSGQKKE